MTFQQLYLECIDLHFDPRTIKPSIVKRWVNAAEAELWNARAWVFKRVPSANITVTAGAGTEPADFGKVLRLYDPNGERLLYLTPDEFESNYSAPSPTPTGSAEAYTVINRQVLVGPAATGTFKLAYRRRYAHLNAAQAVVAGPMALDTDTPLWDSEHHYALVPRALVIGARLSGETAPQNFQDESDRLTAAMAEELVGGVEGEPTFWGVAC